eukprot:11894039-Alexandrium_andersonii.AAC.1
MAPVHTRATPWELCSVTGAPCLAWPHCARRRSERAVGHGRVRLTRSGLPHSVTKTWKGKP